jgi:hypothetical protein
MYIVWPRMPVGSGNSAAASDASGVCDISVWSSTSIGSSDSAAASGALGASGVGNISEEVIGTFEVDAGVATLLRFARGPFGGVHGFFVARNRDPRIHWTAL